MSITEKELQSLREEQEKFLPNIALQIKRKSFVGGEQTYVPDVIATDVPCRLTPGYGTWRNVADKFQGITAFQFTAAYGVDIKAGDELVDENSLTYQVRDVLAPKAYSTATRALLDLVTD